MNTKAPSFGLETKYGPVIVRMQGGPDWASAEAGRYEPGTFYDGKAHINDNKPALIFRGQEYIGFINLTRESGEWMQREGFPGDRFSRRPQWDKAPKTHHAAMVAAIVAELQTYLTEHPEVLEQAREYRREYESNVIRQDIADSESKLADEKKRLRNLRAALRKLEDVTENPGRVMSSCPADHAVVRQWCDVCPECGAILEDKEASDEDDD